MAPKTVLERVKEVYLTKIHADPGANKEEEEQQFKRITQLVKDVYCGYPFNKLDPGCFCEIEHLCAYDDTAIKERQEPLNADKHKGGKGLSRDDVRLLRAQEILRDVYYLAYTSKRGFKGIGRPPELQQLIASTCNSIYGSHIMYPDIRGTSREAELLKKLSPHLRATLLAEVASGILCPR